MSLEPLQHDPRTKQQIKDLLYASLYEPIHNAFQKRLEHIIIKNTMLIGASHKSFVYKGANYSLETSRPPTRMNRLHASMKQEMDEYLSEIKALNDHEVPYVLGFINQVLNTSNDLCDYLKVLPEPLHFPLKKLIATCPCRSHTLTDQLAQDLLDKNQKSIELIKERMVRNLLV